MKQLPVAAILAATSLGLWWFSVCPSAAQRPVLSAFFSNGMKAVIDELRPQAERALGQTLSIRFGTTAALRQRIEAGEAFDVAVLTADAITGLVQDGKLAADSRASLARCGIGVGMRAGSAKPDISSPDALQRTLRRARSITYAQDGASRIYLEQMFQRFGMAEEMKSKTIMAQGSAGANALVQAGKAEYVLTLVSEILPAPGVALVGPLPAEVQSYVNFAGGVSAKAAHAGAAGALLRFLKGPAAAPVYRAKGMESR